MKKEFLPYELEVKLVELGFNEKTFDVHSDIVTQGFKVVKKPTPRILFQQAFRFFRNEYKYIVVNIVDNRNQILINQGYNYIIETIEKRYQSNEVLNTYEEAELACIRKLIEIVKEQNVK